MTIRERFICACGARKASWYWRSCRPCKERRLFTTLYLSGATLAHAAVARERAAGRLPDPKQLPCADCGGSAIEYDHRDYNYPLYVEPVCRRCNRLRGSAIAKVWGVGEFSAYLERVRAQNQPRPATVLRLAAMFPEFVPTERAAA